LEYAGNGNTIADKIRMTVVDLEITSVVGVVGASIGKCFCFDENRPGVCSFRAQGTTGVGGDLDTGLQWSLTAIDGSTLTTSPAAATGPQVTFTYTTLPSLNSEFGKKMLTLTHPSFPFVEEKEVEIYYAFGATNWPDAAPEPPPPPYSNPANWYFTRKNWYYYYHQTSADMGCTYRYDTSECNPLNYPSYTPYVGGIANPEYVSPYTDPRSGISIKNTGDTLFGIDCFAYASRHEFRHHVDYATWWGTMGGWNAACDNEPDYLIDVDEEPCFAPCDGGPYYYWTAYTHSTAPATWGFDDQFKCLFSQDTYGPPDEHKDIDWAYPGSRWKSP
jgi:hypothetical protein